MTASCLGKFKITLLINIVAISIGSTSTIDFDNILNTTFQKQDEMSRLIKDAAFQGDFSYVETDSKGDTTKTINAKRYIYYKENNIQKTEYLSMSIDGRALSPEEIKKQTRDNQHDYATRLPFDKRYRGHYQFGYIQDTVINNLEVWQIKFTPTKKRKNDIEGFAYISKIDTNIVRYQFQPIGLPFVVKGIKIFLDFAQQQNFYLPEKFSLKMELDVKIIFSFYHKYIAMQELYSNYQLNIIQTDSLFDKN